MRPPAQRLSCTGAGGDRCENYPEECESDLFEAIGGAIEKGWYYFKLYFIFRRRLKLNRMAAIGDLCGRLYDRFRDCAPSLQDVGECSRLVPKAHTPFQWEPQMKLDEMRERSGYWRRLKTGAQSRFQLARS